MTLFDHQCVPIESGVHCIFIISTGMRIAIVGVGPVGLASLITAGLYDPKEIFVIDVNQHRLDTSVMFGTNTKGDLQHLF